MDREVPGGEPVSLDRRTRSTAGTLHRHDAVLYATDEEFVDAAAAHLREGEARGEQLLVACTEEQTSRVLAAVGTSSSVAVLGADVAYSSPSTAMDAYLEATASAVAAGHAGLCVVGELPAASHGFPHSWPGWSRYEAVINRVFSALPFRALCAYDTRSTDPALLAAVRATHPQVRQGDTRSPNVDYCSPVDLLHRWSDPAVLPLESTAPLVEIADIRRPGDATDARHRVAEVLVALDTVWQPHAWHLPPADPTLVEVGDYLLAVDEVLGNALEHGVPPAVLRLWVDHDHVVTTVTDEGAGIDDPFMGYTKGSGRDTGGDGPQLHLGLWLARQMCDELTFRREPAGFTVRLRADLDMRSG